MLILEGGQSGFIADLITDAAFSLVNSVLIDI
jgi:hypothetical protein